MMMIVSDLVYILKMVGPKGTPSDDGNDDDNDDDGGDDDDGDNDDDLVLNRRASQSRILQQGCAA